MKYIKKFEAKIRDIAITHNTELSKLTNINFQNDERLIFDVFIKKYNKHIFLKWLDSEHHPMLDRIKTRTSFKYVSEFNKLISDGFNQVFDKYFDQIIPTINRYALYFEENNFYLLVDMSREQLFKDYTLFFIPSITISSPVCYKTLNINDDFV